MNKSMLGRGNYYEGNKIGRGFQLKQGPHREVSVEGHGDHKKVIVAEA